MLSIGAMRLARTVQRTVVAKTIGVLAVQPLCNERQGGEAKSEDHVKRDIGHWVQSCLRSNALLRLSLQIALRKNGKYPGSDQVRLEHMPRTYPRHMPRACTGQSPDRMRSTSCFTVGVKLFE